jgi:thymidylate kinase
MHNIKNIMELIPCNKHESKEVYAVKNPDGTIRWIWPVELKKPEFLRFYNESPTKAAIYVVLIKLIFSLRLQSWFFSKQKVNVPDILGEKWAIFTGTIGVQQKLVIYVNDTFVKLPVGENAKVSLEREKSTLNWLQKQTFSTLRHPKIIENGGFEYCQTAFDKNLKRSPILTNTHLDFTQELFSKSLQKVSLSESESYVNSMALLQQLEHDPKMPKGLHAKLYLLQSQLNQDKLTDFGCAHGDFTSWNMYISENKLFVYDWEAADAAMSKGFDLFHFIIQQGILVGRNDWSKTYQVLSEKLLRSEKHPFFESIDEMNRYLSLYLLYHITRSMSNYVAQTYWHPQIYWMINMWNTALDNLIVNTSQRQLFINTLFDHLKPIEYAGIKLSDAHPDLWSEDSDIDILMKQKDLSYITQLCHNSPLKNKVVTTSKSFMENIAIYFHDGSFLSLDLIHKLKRKHQVFLDADALLSRSIVNDHGIKTLHPTDEMRYIVWFYALNNTQVPFNYMGKKIHLQYANGNEDLALMSYCKGDTMNVMALNKIIQTKAENRGWKGLKNKLFYYLDTIRSFFQNGGLVITFSGVDGAGKSTIIELVKHKIEKNLRKDVIVLRHRPSILPIISALRHGKEKAEAISVSKLPRTGQNKNLLSSMFRFGYYYIDFILGQFYVYVKYVMRGKVVLYDRYYFDFINDGKRSNILLPTSWIKFGYRFLLKPDLNYFLYADANTIISRKQELDINTIKSLTAEYKNLFTAFSKTYDKGGYFSIKNEILEDTLFILFHGIKTKISQI